MGIKDEHRLADQNGTICSYPREDPEITEYCMYGTLYFYKKKKKTEDLICSVGTVCNRWASRSRELSYRIVLIGSLYISKSVIHTGWKLFEVHRKTHSKKN